MKIYIATCHGQSTVFYEFSIKKKSKQNATQKSHTHTTFTPKNIPQNIILVKNWSQVNMNT